MESGRIYCHDMMLGMDFEKLWRIEERFNDDMWKEERKVSCGISFMKKVL